MRKLYIDFGLTIRQIELISEGNWPTRTITDALEKSGIPRPKSGYRRPVYGMKKVSGFQVIHKEEQKAIKWMLDLREAGKSLREIGAALNGRGVPTPMGGVWSAAQVSRIIERERAKSAGK